METEKVIFFRNFLFRTFIISVAFTLLIAIGTLAFWNTWASLVANVFRIEEKELGELILAFFINVRIILIFFMLAPALALHWMIRKKKP